MMGPRYRGKAVDGLRTGGLIRCCLETLNDLYPYGPAQIATEGQRIQCKYANDDDHGWMIFHDGHWSWDKEMKAKKLDWVRSRSATSEREAVRMGKKPEEGG